MYLRDELDHSQQRYSIIRTFLRTPRFDDDNVEEVIKRYLISTAFLNIVLEGARDHATARKTLKGIKEAVEEVDACRRGIAFSGKSSQLLLAYC